jgi:hypothetical protein
VAAGGVRRDAGGRAGRDRAVTGAERSASPTARKENAAILEDRGVNLAHRRENSRGLPHTPSLELSVLPNGGGQCIELLTHQSAIGAPTNSRT